MSKGRIKKILIQVQENGVPVYGHFCYIPGECYAPLREQVRYNVARWLKEHIEQWLKEDFDQELHLDRMVDLYCARQVIKENYFATHKLKNASENNQTIFIQGIVKDWLTEHIDKYTRR